MSSIFNHSTVNYFFTKAVLCFHDDHNMIFHTSNLATEIISVKPKDCPEAIGNIAKCIIIALSQDGNDAPSHHSDVIQFLNEFSSALIKTGYADQRKNLVQYINETASFIGATLKGESVEKNVLLNFASLRVWEHRKDTLKTWVAHMGAKLEMEVKHPEITRLIPRIG